MHKTLEMIEEARKQMVVAGALASSDPSLSREVRDKLEQYADDAWKALYKLSLSYKEEIL